MKKIRVLAAALGAVLLMSGCASLLEREYSVVEPHSQKYWEAGDSNVLRAEEYQELVNGILTLVAAHTTESTVRIYMPELSLMETEELLQQACREIQTETAMGAYAVEYLTYTLSESTAYREADVRIRYRRTAEQYASAISVTSVTTVEAMEELIRGALEEDREELTLRIHYFTADAEEIRALLETLEQEYQGEDQNEESADWSVEFYPSIGEQRIVELFLPKKI